MNKLLSELRNLRNFNVDTYIDKKINQINNFFTENGLDAVVLGISGGIDSATTLALLMKAADKENSPIKKITALSMPIFCKGTTDQKSAIELSLNDIEKYRNNKKFKFRCDDLSLAHSAYVQQRNGETTPFSSGQLASIVRTPHLYFNAAILQTEGYKSLVCGTTNRDEGFYIGFFGKASDAMVDFQPIMDIHKNEVYQVAKKLNVAELIINATPKGDVFDGRNDVEMIGASYDAVELTTLCFDFREIILKNSAFMQDYLNFFESVSYTNIKNLHLTNQHKYKVGTPFHILNVMGFANSFRDI